MATGKKSFVLYADIIHVVKKLPKEKAGELFVTILEYVNDMNPSVEDFSVDLVFEPIRQQLKRDLKDWEGKKLLRSESGKLGGIKSGESRRRKQNEAKEANASMLEANEANEAVNVNVSVNDTVTTKEERNIKDVVVAEKEINNNFFQLFRRCAGSHISDSELRREIGKFRNKYPNNHPNQSGALINAWVGNIGKEPQKEKKMVL